MKSVYLYQSVLVGIVVTVHLETAGHGVETPGISRGGSGGGRGLLAAVVYPGGSSG